MKRTCFILLLTAIGLNACSEDTAENKQEHLWRQQVDTLKKTQQLRDQLNLDSQKKQQRLDEVKQ